MSHKKERNNSIRVFANESLTPIHNGFMTVDGKQFVSDSVVVNDSSSWEPLWKSAWQHQCNILKCKLRNVKEMKYFDPEQIYVYVKKFPGE